MGKMLRKGIEDMKKIYNKLVRDNIPKIITSSGKECDIEVLDEDRYLTMLDNKLNEECEEYQVDKNLEELADIIEVVYAITKARGYTIEDLERLRQTKANERGAFNDRILLKEVRSEK